MATIGTLEASKRLGITQGRIAELIREGRLPASKIGTSWAIDEKDLHLIEDRPRGFPKGKKRK